MPHSSGSLNAIFTAIGGFGSALSAWFAWKAFRAAIELRKEGQVQKVRALKVKLALLLEEVIENKEKVKKSIESGAITSYRIRSDSIAAATLTDDQRSILLSLPSHLPSLVFSYEKELTYWKTGSVQVFHSRHPEVGNNGRAFARIESFEAMLALMVKELDEEISRVFSKD